MSEKSLRAKAIPVLRLGARGSPALRSDFSDVAPSVTSFEPIFLPLPLGLSCGHRQCDDPPRHRLEAPPVLVSLRQ